MWAGILVNILPYQIKNQQVYRQTFLCKVCNNKDTKITVNLIFGTLYACFAPGLQIFYFVRRVWHPISGTWAQ